MELMDEGAETCPHCGYNQKTAQSSLCMKPGSILYGKYLVGRILGQGGFGMTYIGYDLKLEGKVAIKEYFPMGNATRSGEESNQVEWNTTVFDSFQWQRGCENFLKEARRMEKMSSFSNIVRVRDTFTENGTAYIVMDYIEGETLKKRLERTGIMTFRECMKLFAPLMESLARMHEKGFIHRDISPDNIMIRKDGNAFLLDFGAAKDLSFSRGLPSQQVVKNGFSPLEQYQEEGKLGPWTDVYALCATIYYCITGKVPPSATDRLTNDSLDFPNLKEPMPPNIVMALKDGLAVRADKRIQNIDLLMQRMKIEPPPKPAWLEWLLKHKTVAGAAVLALCVTVLAAAAVVLWPEANPDEKVLMKDDSGEWIDDVYYGKVLGSGINRDKIATVSFTDTLKFAPDTAWDVSWGQDGTVKAWTQQNPDHSELYDLFIGAKGGVRAKDCRRLFTGYYNVESISFNDCYDTSGAVSMESMFQCCENLTDLDVSGFDTSSVTDMSRMFWNCGSLTQLDVGGFDTSSATNMYAMFSNCENLTDLDVSGFDTSSVIDMRWMFEKCSSLKELDVSGFDTSSVGTIRGIFLNCKSLTDLDVSGFNTSSVTDMQGMFKGCENLTGLDVSGFDTSRVTDMGWMFFHCKNLTDLDVSGFDTSSVQNMKSMFNDCRSLSELDVSGFDTGNVTDMSYMFYNCVNLTKPDISSFAISPDTKIDSMFLIGEDGEEGEEAAVGPNVLMKDDNYKEGNDGVWSGTVLGTKISRNKIRSVTFLNTLASMPNSAWDVSSQHDGTVMAWTMINKENADMFDLYIGSEGGVKGENCYALFFGYNNVEEINFNGSFDTSRVTDMGCMFRWCKNLTKLDLNGFDTGSVKNMGLMFSGCSKLLVLDLSSFDTGNVTDMNSMFADCKNLIKLDLSSFKTGTDTNTSDMFKNCGVTAEQAGLKTE